METDRRVAVITGGSQGIGVGLRGIPGAGVAVVASALTIKPPGDPGLLTVGGHIADPATAGRIIDAAPGRFGCIDTLVNNADAFVSKPFTDYTAADYALVAEVRPRCRVQHRHVVEPVDLARLLLRSYVPRGCGCLQ